MSWNIVAKLSSLLFPSTSLYHSLPIEADLASKVLNSHSSRKRFVISLKDEESSSQRNETLFAFETSREKKEEIRQNTKTLCSRFLLKKAKTIPYP